MESSPELLFEIPRGLEQSILLAVLIGFLVTLFLVESFGWVFVGVVVPGYLASVLVIQPPAALAVVLDASLTYIVAKMLEMILGRGGASSEFFGRERFFLLVLVSVFVRQHTQTWLWPLALETVDPMVDIPVDFARSFSSIGIVLVPLMANIMWKLDLRRGMWHLALTSLVTYALLAWWLLPETTLSYSALELSYEDTAIDFLGNAKAYIIFLTTAYVASQLNLYYGWDFNGILVPALLGLLWFHPAKLATTFGEAMVVYMVTVRMPRAPILRSINLEGPRRLALVFTTSVTLKWLIGWILGDSLPTLKITDAYGFGYLLPSLLVIKMMQRKSMRAVLLPTAVASCMGFVIGNLIGFALSFADPAPKGPDEAAQLQTNDSTRLLSSAAGVGALGHLHALERATTFADHGQNVAYRRVWETASRWLDTPTPHNQAAVLEALGPTKLELVAVGEHEGRPAYALVERDLGPRQGWDTALLVPGAPGPVIAVPRPVAEAPIAESASVLCRRMRCRALLIAGVDVERDPMMRMSTSSFDIARGALRDTPMMILRSDDAMGRKPILHIGAELPSSVDLRRAWPTEVGLEWSDPPVEFAARPPAQGGTLRIHPLDIEAMLASSSPSLVNASTPPPWVMLRDRDPLLRTLPPGQTPSKREARYLELEVVAPLVEIAAGRRPTSELERLSWAAERLGMELWRIDDCGAGRPCLGLIDPLGDDGMGWGSLLVRWGETREIGIELLRPGMAFGTQQLGLELWQQANARAIYVGPSNAHEGQNPLALGNIQAPLMPFHQALDRSLGDDVTRPLLVQVLGFGVERQLDTPMVVGLGRPVLDEGQQPLKLRWLLEQGPLQWVERPLFSDGSPLLHALSGLGSPAVEYSLELGQADVALLWFSPQVRGRYVRRAQGGEQRRSRALGLEYQDNSELERLAPEGITNETTAPPAPMIEEIDELLRLATSYRLSHDIHALRRIQNRARGLTTEEVTVRVSVGGGTISKLPMVWVEATGPQWGLRGMVLLESAVDRRTTLVATEADLREQIGLALFRRDGIVVVRSGPPSGGPDAP